MLTQADMVTSNDNGRPFSRLETMLLDARRRKMMDAIFERKKKTRMERLNQNLGLDNFYKDGLLFIKMESAPDVNYLDLVETCSPFTLGYGLLRLSVYEQYFGMSRFSACYPLDPELFSRSQQTENRMKTLAYLAKPSFKCATQRQSWKQYLVNDGMEGPGASMNVVSLLTLCDGRRLVNRSGKQIVLDKGTFRGEYVLVCCFNVPVIWENNDFQSLLNLCYELDSNVNNFKMVMVARMNSLADTQTVFDNFLKAFPTSCLAVPYEESKRRIKICKLLDLEEDLKFRLFSNGGKVLSPFSVNCILGHYGAEAFPFTKKIVKKIDAQRRELRKSGLDQLLRLRPEDSHPAVYRFNPAGGPREEMHVSQLISAYIGLYMCCEGSLIPLVHKLYERCRSKQQEFEVVVLYCPFSCALDSECFKAKIDRLMQEQNVCGWWCLPFNNSVSLRFCGLTSSYDNGFALPHDYYSDKLIIVGPDGKILDMYGAEVIKYHGMDVYPFTREALVKEEMKKMREITLESILVPDLYRGLDKRTITAGDLVSSKKKVIIYMDQLHSPHTKYRQKLVSEYNNKIKKKWSPAFEIVFIDISDKDPESREVDAQKIKEMPWLVGKRTPSLEDLRKFIRYPAVVGFGVDGRVCSFQELLSPTAAFSCLEEYTLYQDVYRHLGFVYYREI